MTALLFPSIPIKLESNRHLLKAAMTRFCRLEVIKILVAKSIQGKVKGRHGSPSRKIVVKTEEEDIIIIAG